LRHADPAWSYAVWLEDAVLAEEYFFQVHSGTKLPTRITMKASQNRFQSNEMTESTFSAPMMLRNGKRIPSILQWTLPQDRPFIRQPTHCPCDSGYPESSSSCKGQCRRAESCAGSYYENNGNAPKQIAPGSFLEVFFHVTSVQ